MSKNYVCVSGGADSTALALYLWEQGKDFELIFSDTGAELPENYIILSRLARLIDKKFRVVSGGSFFQCAINKGFMLPGIMCRYCTRLLKIKPQDTFFKEQEAEEVYIGIRADEPTRLYPNKKKWETIYALADAGFTKQDVFDMCEKYNLLNPVYQWRSSVSCFCCFFQRKYDWLGLLQNHPTLYAVAEEWEIQSGLTSNKSYNWNNSYSLTELRTADEDQIKLFPEVKAEPCLICKV